MRGLYVFRALLSETFEAIIALAVVSALAIVTAVAIPLAADIAFNYRCQNDGTRAEICACIAAKTADLPDKALAYRIYLMHLGVPLSWLADSNKPDAPFWNFLAGTSIQCATNFQL